MGRLVIMALALVAALLLAGQLASPVRPLGGSDPQVVSTAAPASTAVPSGTEGLVITRDSTGQFHVDLGINGQTTRFLVDTGADTLALTVADARAAGIEVDEESFQPILKTASGQGWGTLVTVDRLDVGETELHNVSAVVIRDLGVSLLGQSVLAQFGKLELTGDTMVLEPR